MSLGIKVDHFRLWRVSSQDCDLYRWLFDALWHTTQYLGLTDFALPEWSNPMSFHDAIVVFSEHAGVKAIFGSQGLGLWSKNLPMIARDKKHQTPVLLLPYGPKTYEIYRKGSAKTNISHQQANREFDNFVVLFASAHQNSYEQVAKLVNSWLPSFPLIVWSAIALLSISVLVLVSFALLSDYAEDNRISLLLLASFLVVILLVLAREQLFWSWKNYGLGRLVLVHDLYRRLFLLSNANLKQIAVNDIATWVTNARRTCKNFFRRRVYYIFALFLLGVSALLLIILAGSLGFFFIVLWIGIFLLAKGFAREERALTNVREQYHNGLHEDLERLKISLSAFYGLHASSALVEKMGVKKEHLILIASKSCARKFMRNSGLFFLPTLGVLTILCLLALSDRSFELWQTGLLMVFGLAFGMACGFIGDKLSDFSFDIMDSDVKRTFDLWPQVLSNTHVLPVNIRGQIELFSVSFAYAARSQLVIKNLSLTLRAEKFHVIYGPSGSGKSTLLKLLMGELIPDGGQVVIDGQDLRSLDRSSLRQHFGVILEDAHLFAGTVLDNIVCGRNLASKTLENLLLSHEIFDYLLDMPMGLNTYIFWHLKNISHLETSLILLARALVHKPKLLFMDELLDGIGKEHQQMIVSYISDLKITRIMTCHLKSDIECADNYISMDSSQIII